MNQSIDLEAAKAAFFSSGGRIIVLDGYQYVPLPQRKHPDPKPRAKVKLEQSSQGTRQERAQALAEKVAEMAKTMTCREAAEILKVAPDMLWSMAKRYGFSFVPAAKGRVIVKEYDEEKDANTREQLDALWRDIQDSALRSEDPPHVRFAAAILACPTPQPHPEPIAWMVGTAIWWTKEEAERDAAATGKTITPFGPLTGSADIEQLREVIKHSDAQIMRQSMRISNQRAQLAERDALLQRALPYLSNTPDLVQQGAEDLAEEIRSASAGKPCYGPNEWGTECGKCSKCKPASAEPKVKS